MPAKQATIVSINFALSSSAANPPYNVTGCSGMVTYSDGSTLPFNGWGAVDIGTPEANGATFNLTVTDQNYSSSNITNIANWALTFIPRSGTAQQSPFGNNVNTITGNGYNTANNGTFGLNLGNVKIKNAGNWDWALMAQISLPGGTVKCFASDPEMEVDS